MPHIIVEHSSNIEDQIDLPDLLQALHESLTAEGIDKARIKTRSLPLSHAVVGAHGVQGHMVHITLLLLAGRDVPTKKQYADPLHALAKDVLQSKLPQCSVTLEVRDMNPDTYYL